MLLACQSQLSHAGFLSRFGSMFERQTATQVSSQTADVKEYTQSVDDVVPTFPPAEGFCTNVYCLADDEATRISATSSVHLSKFTTDRPHPSVIKFQGQKSQSVAAKFRSLSKRTLAIYWDDGKDGIYQGLLRPGQTTQSNSYSGHRFFFTEEKDKRNVVDLVTIQKDKILNVIRDKEMPLDAGHPVAEQTLREEEYDRQYMAKNDGLRYTLTHSLTTTTSRYLPETPCCLLLLHCFIASSLLLLPRATPLLLACCLLSDLPFLSSHASSADGATSSAKTGRALPPN